MTSKEHNAIDIEELAGEIGQKIMDNLKAARLILPTSGAQAQDMWEVIRDTLQAEMSNAIIAELQAVKAGAIAGAYAAPYPNAKAAYGDMVDIIQQHIDNLNSTKQGIKGEASHD